MSTQKPGIVNRRIGRLFIRRSGVQVSVPQSPVWKAELVSDACVLGVNVCVDLVLIMSVA